jgi:benzoyl-CoA reductase/2-hydroxyglutaryl-CoA dehydratase subunit BcrC/BadD/HgdB
LSGIANAIHILKKNMDKVDWSNMSRNHAAIHILEKNQDKIDWNSLSYNSEIFDYSYEYLEERCNVFKEELIQKAMNPKKLQRYIDEGYDMEEFLEFI